MLCPTEVSEDIPQFSKLGASFHICFHSFSAVFLHVEWLGFPPSICRFRGETLVADSSGTITVITSWGFAFCHFWVAVEKATVWDFLIFMKMWAPAIRLLHIPSPRHTLHNYRYTPVASGVYFAVLSCGWAAGNTISSTSRLAVCYLQFCIADAPMGGATSAWSGI